MGLDGGFGMSLGNAPADISSPLTQTGLRRFNRPHIRTLYHLLGGFRLGNIQFEKRGIFAICATHPGLNGLQSFFMIAVFPPHLFASLVNRPPSLSKLRLFELGKMR